ncbi:hypothetical protein GCM10009759_38010 [Kitasatospora saccharophila]|uniref:Haloacid dehalogenase-like hydrolase n=1 Tax=Kitasatospora saccharophila TaxID=407973 RepID=A0ABP5IM14_9ACTN
MATVNAASTPGKPVELVVFDCDGVLVVEDSPAGMRAARAAGMRRLGYTGGPTGRALAGGEFGHRHFGKDGYQEGGGDGAPDTVLFSEMRHLPALLRTLTAG